MSLVFWIAFTQFKKNAVIYCRSKHKADTSQRKKKSFAQTKQEFERRKKQAEKRQKEEDRKEKFLKRKEALQNYKEQKSKKFKVLSRKTSKGQPLMSGRMEMLLEKIKATTDWIK